MNRHGRNAAILAVALFLAGLPALAGRPGAGGGGRGATVPIPAAALMLTTVGLALGYCFKRR